MIGLQICTTTILTIMQSQTKLIFFILWLNIDVFFCMANTMHVYSEVTVTSSIHVHAPHRHRNIDDCPNKRQICEFCT